ncbi:MAG: branched chain amino acid aminotransferase [Fusobacteriia bacterium 4572_132]|nr:MAG: branched chain amino acid aminotransferase [Fusobacteriia bacterium 4572_132]
MKEADKIWMNGKFVDWKDANVHVLSHVLHYGSGFFEGIRYYKTKNGSAIFRLEEHIDRLYDSAKIYRTEIPYSKEEFIKALIETLKINKLESAYIRPLVYRGYKEMGVNPQTCPVDSMIAAWEWGTYLGKEALENGVSVKISSWRRLAPDTMPTMAKASGNYMSSQLIKMEALEDGYDEGIALDYNGYVSEGSGENLFIIKDNIIYTPAMNGSALPGITRDSIIKIALDLGYEIKETGIPREMLYIADELFFTGTAAEVTPVNSVDKIKIGEGKRGPITEKLQKRFFEIVKGEVEDKYGWLTEVK